MDVLERVDCQRRIGTKRWGRGRASAASDGGIYEVEENSKKLKELRKWIGVPRFREIRDLKRMIRYCSFLFFFYGVFLKSCNCVEGFIFMGNGRKVFVQVVAVPEVSS